jgi:hypothetical protein
MIVKLHEIFLSLLFMVMKCTLLFGQSTMSIIHIGRKTLIRKILNVKEVKWKINEIT